MKEKRTASPTPTRQELEEYSEWYKPSKSEEGLMQRILSELDNILEAQNIFGRLKWSSKKAFVRIPYKVMAKVECISKEKTFSIPVEIKAVDEEKEKILISFIINKKEIRKEMEHIKISHGYINHEYRTYVPKLETVPVVEKKEPKYHEKKFIPLTNEAYKRNNNVTEPAPIYYGCCDD